MHLAAAANVQTVALFAPTNPDEWKPIGDNVKALRPQSGIIDDVTVDEAVQVLYSSLQRQGKVISRGSNMNSI